MPVAAHLETREIQPKILYYGTPVVLLTTRNADGSPNISPLSSSWALGQTIVLGLSVLGQAYENLRAHRACVVNVPGPELWPHVERLAPLTGRIPVPEAKAAQFRHERDKFAAAGLTPVDSTRVAPPRIAECGLQIEARVRSLRVPAHDRDFAIIEAQAVAVHAHTRLIVDAQHVDPGLWSPLIYSFRHYFGLGPELGRTFRAEV